MIPTQPRPVGWGGVVGVREDGLGTSLPLQKATPCDVCGA